MRGISWLAENRLESQEGLCSIEMVLVRAERFFCLNTRRYTYIECLSNDVTICEGFKHSIHKPNSEVNFWVVSVNPSTPGRYNPCSVLADSRSRLQPSLSSAVILQFLIPSLSASLITPSIQLRFGLPTRLLPSGLSKMIFLHGRLSCIRTICPAHLRLVILIAVTKSTSSYRRYSSSLYLDLHVTPSQIGPLCLSTPSL